MSYRTGFWREWLEERGLLDDMDNQQALAELALERDRLIAVVNGPSLAKREISSHFAVNRDGSIDQFVTRQDTPDMTQARLFTLAEIEGAMSAVANRTADRQIDDQLDKLRTLAHDRLEAFRASAVALSQGEEVSTVVRISDKATPAMKAQIEAWADNFSKPQSLPAVLFEGPKGHKYRVDDVRHALNALRVAGVNVDVPLEKQFKLLAECANSQPLRLIGMDYGKRNRNREKLVGAVPWPERIKLDSKCAECSGEGGSLDEVAPAGPYLCDACDGRGVCYKASNETMRRAHLTALRALSFSGMRAAGIYLTAMKMAPKGPNNEVGPQATALGLTASLCELAALLAQVATLPDGTGTDAEVIATFRRELIVGLNHIAAVTAVGPAVVH